MSRSGRGWGPFSGAQLTTMVCVIVAAVAFPVAASAVSGSNVFVTDATSGKTAKVSTAGAVTVAGTVGSKLQGSTSGNKAEVSADQQLLVTEANASSDYTSASSVTGGDAATPQLNSVPGGDAVIVKEVHINAFGTSGTDPFFGVFLSTDQGCVGGRVGIEAVDVASGVSSVNDLPFDPGLVVPAGDQLCMQSLVGASADTAVVGYVIPAADAAGAIHGARSTFMKALAP
jgi:hypothetical protein